MTACYFVKNISVWAVEAISLGPEMPPFGCCSVTPCWPLAWTQSSWLGVVWVGLSLDLNRLLNKSCWKIVQEVFLLLALWFPVFCIAPEGGGGICFWLSLAEVWWSLPFQAEGRICLEVLDSIEEKKIPVKWLSHLGKIFSSEKKLEQC